MKPESIVFLISGAVFGLIVGWILGSQQPTPRPPSTSASSAQADAPSANQSRDLRAIDEAEVAALVADAEREPSNAAPRAALANVYFDAERFDTAITWYEEALALDPGNVNVSTDLGVSYYYTDQPDRALEQFAHSLDVDPAHTKTILNMGIVRAFGKQDLKGAAEAWERLIEIAPESPEGRAARQALDSLRAAHPGGVGTGDDVPPSGGA